MRSNLPRLARLLWLFLLLSLTGCVYLRLLEFKSQLAKFDENFKIDAGEHFAVQLLHPVLYRDDFVELSKLEPSRVEATPNGKRTLQIYRKLDEHGRPQPGKDIVFTLDFDQDDRLTRWDFSPVFMAIAPAPFLEASLRSLGKGKVDEGKRQLQVDPKDLPKVTAKPPTRQQIVALLGQPHEQRMDDGLRLYVYRFLMETPWVKEGFDDRKNTSIQLKFDPKTDELVKMRGKFAGLKISINFRSLGEDAQVPLETVR